MTQPAKRGLFREAVISYVGQLYMVAIGFLAVPVYVRFLGTEAYGLVGFYATLQAWFLLLDLGMSQTLSREVARCRGGATSPAEFHGALRVVEYVVFGLAFIGGLAIALLAPGIATDWLKLGALSPADVVDALRMMAVMLALRWISTLYRGLIVGCENQSWLGYFNIVSSTLRFGLIIGGFVLLGGTVVNYFALQLVVSVLETVALFARAYALIPTRGTAVYRSTFARTITLVKFSGTVVAASVVWTLVSQLDKLWLSRVLPLQEYGGFSIATLLASSLFVVSAPIGTIVLPRLTRLYAENDTGAALALYSQATQWATVIVAPIAVTLALYPQEILLVWSGSNEAAIEAGTVLRLYAVGNALVAIFSFPYYMQYAIGSLKWHIIGNLLIVPIFTPMLVVLASRYGAAGAGTAWLVTNSLYIALWIPLIHHKFAPGYHWHWVRGDIAPALLAALAAGGFMRLCFLGQTQRFMVAAIVCSGLAAVIASGLASSEGRRLLRKTGGGLRFSV